MRSPFNRFAGLGLAAALFASAAAPAQNSENATPHVANDTPVVKTDPPVKAAPSKMSTKQWNQQLATAVKEAKTKGYVHFKMPPRESIPLDSNRSPLGTQLQMMKVHGLENAVWMHNYALLTDTSEKQSGFIAQALPVWAKNASKVIPIVLIEAPVHIRDAKGILKPEYAASWQVAVEDGNTLGANGKHRKFEFGIPDLPYLEVTGTSMGRSFEDERTKTDFSWGIAPDTMTDKEIKRHVYKNVGVVASNINFLHKKAQAKISQQIANKESGLELSR